MGNLIWFILAFACLEGALSVDLSGCHPNQPKVINLFFDTKGELYSPGYNESGYPNDLFCEYTLTAHAFFRIKLTFQELDIDPFDLCMKDMLIIHDGSNDEGPVHGIFCGNETPNALLSGGNSLHLVFRSDFLTGRKGFRITYEAALGHTMCPLGQALCRNRNCFHLGEKCNGVDECGDGTDEENCNRPIMVSVCGDTPIMPQNISADMDRVVGGLPAIPGSWPWQADLQLGYFYPNGHMCGGTLINAQWVLSAAHCFGGNSRPEEWRIHLGNYHKFETDKHEQVRYVQRIIVFPGFTGNQIGETDMENDIALVKLNAPVQITDHVRPACLPTQGRELTAGTKCMATGWGMTRGTGHNDVLKQVELSIQKAKACENHMIPFLNKTMICVRNEKGFHDVCHGDSGGPLACKTQNVWYVMGATSYGTEFTFESGMCALPGAHTVYSKVADKVTWIQTMIRTYG